MSFDHDFQWQKGLGSRVQEVIVAHLPEFARVTVASFEEDTQRNTDFVLETSTARFSCRLRRFDQMRYAPTDFTIRSRRDSGTRTELHKVISGWGDYLFYGFENADGTDLAAWLIGNLSNFRLWHARETSLLPKGRLPGVEKPNGDGSWFRIYEIDKVEACEPGFVVARHLPLSVVSAA